MHLDYRISEKSSPKTKDLNQPENETFGEQLLSADESEEKRKELM